MTNRPARRAWLAASLLFLLASTNALLAQPTADDNDSQQPAVATPVSSEAPATSAGTVRVVDAWGQDPLTGKRRSERKVTVGDHFVVQVTDIPTLLQHDPRGCFALRLFLDSSEVVHLEPVVCHRTTNQIHFSINHIDRASEPAWQRLLDQRIGFDATADVSVGLHDGMPLPTAIEGNQALRIVLVPVTPSFISLALFLATVGLFFWLAHSSEILRAAGPAPPRGRRPFSLSRAQMAFWFLMVLGSFLLLSLITGDMVDIPASILGLIGIAASTYIGSEMVAAGKRASHQHDEATTTAIVVAPAAGSDPTAADGAPSDTTADPATRAAVGAVVAPAAVRVERLKPSRGFLLDLLSDAQGVSFARFQIFVWTIVLGFLFIAKVWQRLAMPDFDPTLLGLMGISAGTYLGFKVPEDDEKG